MVQGYRPPVVHSAMFQAGEYADPKQSDRNSNGGNTSSTCLCDIFKKIIWRTTVKAILITVSLILFSTSSFADEEKDCSWFPTMLFKCEEDFKCSYQATPDGPVFERELISQNNSCLHKETLPGGLLLECEWWGLVERSGTRVDLIPSAWVSTWVNAKSPGTERK
jgi:hypothetical protein